MPWQKKGKRVPRRLPHARGVDPESIVAFDGMPTLRDRFLLLLWSMHNCQDDVIETERGQWETVAKVLQSKLRKKGVLVSIKTLMLHMNQVMTIGCEELQIKYLDTELNQLVYIHWKNPVSHNVASKQFLLQNALVSPIQEHLDRNYLDSFGGWIGIWCALNFGNVVKVAPELAISFQFWKMSLEKIRPHLVVVQTKDDVLNNLRILGNLRLQMSSLKDLMPEGTTSKNAIVGRAWLNISPIVGVFGYSHFQQPTSEDSSEQE
jgi:hypothetical protein